MTCSPDIVFAAAPAAGGFAVTSGGRTMKTPAGQPLVVPSEALARAIATELTAHGMKAGSTARLRRMAAAAIDRDANGREDAVAGVAAYAASDLLCYRAGAPADLAVRQEDAWQPLLDWAADRYGAHLVVTDGVVPVGQDAGALSRMGDAVSVLDAWQLAGVAAAAVATGSLVLAMALFEGCVDAAQAWRASRIDADFQAAQWGADEEADAAAGEVRADIDAAARLLALLGD